MFGWTPTTKAVIRRCEVLRFLFHTDFSKTFGYDWKTSPKTSNITLEVQRPLKYTLNYLGSGMGDPQGSGGQRSEMVG